MSGSGPESNVPMREARLSILRGLSSRLAHDMRTPLMVIRNAAYFLRRCCPATADSTESLDMIDAGVKELNEQIAGLVDLTAEWKLDPKDVDLAGMLSEVKSRVGGGSSVLWRFELPETPLVIRCDPVRMERVLRELCRNALAAIRGRGDILIRVMQNAQATLLEIRDSGPGVPAEVRAELFEPFVTTRPSGLGLGLAMSRQAVERHGGSIELVESESGGVFRIMLPRTPRVEV